MSLTLTSSLFPYTTLFRSLLPQPAAGRDEDLRARDAGGSPRDRDLERLSGPVLRADGSPLADRRHRPQRARARRSEEHTSELQSRENLVCRLLLEKKKI